MGSSGLITACSPAAAGGADPSFAEMIEASIEIAWQDGSFGWTRSGSDIDSLGRLTQGWTIGPWLVSLGAIGPLPREALDYGAPCLRTYVWRRRGPRGRDVLRARQPRLAACWRSVGEAVGVHTAFDGPPAPPARYEARKNDSYATVHAVGGVVRSTTTFANVPHPTELFGWSVRRGRSGERVVSRRAVVSEVVVDVAGDDERDAEVQRSDL